MSNSEARGGQCQCGGVRYQLSGPPLTFYVCHCLDCQKQSGSAFGLSLWVLPAHFDLVRGELKEWRTRGGSGAVKICTFCADCGTRIYHAGTDRQAPLSLKAGTLDDLSTLRPAAQLWTMRAHPWVSIDQPHCLELEGEPHSDRDLVESWNALHRG